MKPANIMLTADGGVKVMDFGIARASAQDTLTQTATVLGTAAYLSPEQARGDRVDHRSDLYSLGCVLYAMLAGDPPFTGDNAVAVATRHLTEEARPIAERRGDVPPALGAVVTRALAKEPTDRFPDAAAMGAALREAARTEPTPTLPLPVAPPTHRRPIGRRRTALVLLAIAVVFGAIAYLATRDDAPLPTGTQRDRPAQTEGRQEPSPEEASPSPSAPEEEGDALAVAFQGLVQVLGEGVAAGEVSADAQMRIIDGAQKVLEELDKGDAEKAIDELDKVREEARHLFEQGEITTEERLGSILAALDELESAIAANEPVEEEERGEGPPGGEPPGLSDRDDD